jgi:hypothetical protein
MSDSSVIFVEEMVPGSPQKKSGIETYDYHEKSAPE